MDVSENKIEYKGYIGEFSYDEDLGLFEGNITNIQDLILFQGKSMAALRSDFQEAVDDYLGWYNTKGERSLISLRLTHNTAYKILLYDFRSLSSSVRPRMRKYKVRPSKGSTPILDKERNNNRLSVLKIS